MSIYLVKGKGWRYHFQFQGMRYTEGFFKAKKEALEAEDKRKEAVRNPRTTTDTDFLTLCNSRLDYLKEYRSYDHYRDTLYSARMWMNNFKDVLCRDITQTMLEDYLIKRAKVSRSAANKEIRYLKSFFNYGIKRKMIDNNPASDLDFFPVSKTPKYIPKKEDVLKLILAADPEDQDYLWTIKETMGRISEINRLKWDDVNFETRKITLYTRKKKFGNYTPRLFPMSAKLYDVLSRRQKVCGCDTWVFAHRYWSKTEKCFKTGPYQDRKRLMKTLCSKAGIPYFRYHTLRHFGASQLAAHNIPIETIQELLGHENRTTTEIYVHSISGSSRDAINVFDRVNEEMAEKVAHQVAHQSGASGL